MHRRKILWGALSALGAAFATSRADAAAGAAPQGKLKVVYHLSDLDKVSFVLGNIQNPLDAAHAVLHRGGARDRLAHENRQPQLPPLQ